MLLNAEDLLDEGKINTVQQFIDNLPFHIGVKDFNSQCLIANNFTAKLLGFSNGQALRGRYDNEMKCRANKISHLFVAEDSLVIKHRRTVTILISAVYADNKPSLLYGKKYPVINEDETVLSCGFYGEDVTNSQFINLVPLLSLRKTIYGSRQLGDQFSCIITESIPEYNLSNRQMECLFHLLRGQSAKDISLTLNIGKRTVETHIDAIKFKLGCDTKTQLIDKAISTGLLNYIPSSVVNTVLGKR